jgi:hypothetical protein
MRLASTNDVKRFVPLTRNSKYQAKTLETEVVLFQPDTIWLRHPHSLGDVGSDGRRASQINSFIPTPTPVKNRPPMKIERLVAVAVTTAPMLRDV